MARKKDDGYNDALTSVFDFILANNRKPKKSKPLRYRPSGATPGDAFADALSAIAARPAELAAEQGIELVNGTLLDTKLVEFRLDQTSSTKYLHYDKDSSRVRVRASDLPKFLSNPSKFVDAVYTKNAQERSFQKMFLPMVGLGMDRAISSVYAKQNGMTNSEALKFSAATQVDVDPQMRENFKKMMAENAVTKLELEKAAERIRRAHPNLDTTDIDRFSNLVQTEVQRRAGEIKKQADVLYKSMNGNRHLRNFTYLEDPANFDRYSADLVNNLGNSFNGREQELVNSLKEELNSVEGVGVSRYRTGMYRNFDYQGLVASSQAERDRIHKAKAAVLVWERLKGSDEQVGTTTAASQAFIGSEIKRLNDQRAAGHALTAAEQSYLNSLQALKKDFNSISARSGSYQNQARFFGHGPSKPAANREIAQDLLDKQLELDLTKIQFRIDSETDPFKRRLLMMRHNQLANMHFNVGQVPLREYRHFLQSMNGIQTTYSNLLKGGIGAGLINGTFFIEDISGITAPGSFNAHGASFHTRERGPNGTWNFDHKNEFGYLVLPRADLASNHFTRTYGNLAYMYYLTPSGILKSIVNGDYGRLGAFRSQVSAMRIASKSTRDLQGFLSANRNDPLFAQLGLGSLFDPSGNLDPGLVGDNYLKILTFLEEKSAAGALPSGLTSLMKKLQSRQGMAERFLKYGNFMGGKLRSMQSWLGNNVTARVEKLLGKYGLSKSGIANILSKFGKKSELWQQAIAQFNAGTIGLRQLLRQGVIAALNALGFATGGSSVLVGVVVYFAEKVLYKLSKPFVQIGMTAIAGAILLLCFVVFSLSSFLTTTLDNDDVAYANMQPGTASVCVGGGVSPVVPNPPGVPGQPGKPLPPGEGVPPQQAMCPIVVGSVCNQGPFGSVSHSNGKMAIDVSPPGGLWKAPTDGTVVLATQSKMCEWDPGKSRGGEVVFVDSSGNQYKMLHASPLVGTGPVTQGTPIAKMDLSLPTSNCWSGPHLHLETVAGGSYTNTQTWYNNLGCGISCP